MSAEVPAPSDCMTRTATISASQQTPLIPTPLLAWAPIDPANPHTYSVAVTEAGIPILCQFLLNGRPLTPLSQITTITLKPADLPEGDHELRAAISTVTPVRRHTQLIRTITLGRRTVHLSGDGPVPLGHPLPLRIESSEPASRIRVLKGVTELAAQDGTEPIQLDSRRLGTGSSPLHVEAAFADGSCARSETLWVDVLAPVDPVAPLQHADYRPIDRDSIPAKALSGQSVKYKKGTLSVTPGKKKRAIVLIDGLASNRWTSITTTLGWKAKVGTPEADTAGIVFNYRDSNHYDFFGMYRGIGWALLTRDARNIVVHDEWGMPIFFGEDYPLELEVQHPQGIVGRVAGHVVLNWDEGKIAPKPVGLIATEQQPTRFRGLGTR